MLNGQAPAGGTLVTLTSNSPFVSPPASVLIEAGSSSASFAIPTSAVTANTTATVTASDGSASAQAQVTLTPQQPPLSLTLSPTSTTGLGGSSFATVTVASASSTDQILQVASSNPSIASVPNGVMISVSGGGVTKTANLTINPEAPTPTPTATPVAPTLLSPAADARLPQPITFDWSDVANAATYEIQIDDSKSFNAPLTLSQTVSVSQATITGLPTQRLFWRVRAFNSADVAGPFSSSRRFTAQAASTTPSPASLSAVSVSPTSVVGGSPAQGTVTLTGGAPSGGALVSLSSANPSVAAVPASVTVASGASSVTFGVTTSSVSANTSVSITATYNGVSRTTTLTVTPASSTPPPSSDPLPAPSLLSPAADARFSPGTSITFDWTDVSGAASYTIQIDDTETFTSPLVNQNTTASQFTTSSLPTIRMWFRVRANSSSGTSGSWSSIRRFEVKQ
jgi:hypothetical protein